MLVHATTHDEAEAMCDRIAAELGYPKTGTSQGGGIHVPPEQARTLRHVAPVELGTGDWGVPLPPDVAALTGRPGLAFVASERARKIVLERELAVAPENELLADGSITGE